MPGMGTKEAQTPPRSPRLDMGEVDTRAPFQSVKAAVSLFGKGVAARKETSLSRTPKSSEERVLHKETQLHLAEKRISSLKERLKNAENIKTRAQFDLEMLKRTRHDLASKLQAVTESKKLAVEAAEAAKNRAKQLEEVSSSMKPVMHSPVSWRQQMDLEREQYCIVSNEVAIVKQELRKIQQDFDSFLEAKIAAFQQAADAQHAVKMNRERVGGLEKDIMAMQGSLSQMRLATGLAREQKTRISAQRDALQTTHAAVMQEAVTKLLALSKKFDLELSIDFKGKLAQQTIEIEMLQEELKMVRASCLGSVRVFNCELSDAKKTLQMVTDEQGSLQSLVDSVKVELEELSKDHMKLKEKEAETASSTWILRMELDEGKKQHESLLGQENKSGEASDQMITTLHQLTLESKNARQDAGYKRKKIEELRQEAASSRKASDTAEKRLRAAVVEADEARAAQKTVLYQIKMKMKVGAAKIKVPTEEFESWTRKVDECKRAVGAKVADAMVEMEAIKLSENEALKKLERCLAEIRAMNVAAEEALKKAEMAEAAKKAVEGELERRREAEQRDATYTASEILGLPEISPQTFVL